MTNLSTFSVIKFINFFYPYLKQYLYTNDKDKILILIHLIDIGIVYLE